MPFIDEIADLVLEDDHDAIRQRYLGDARLTVPPDITTYIDGQATPAHLAG